MSRRLFGALGGAVASGVLLLACPGRLENPERFTATGSCGDIPSVLEASCAGSGCHGETQAAGLDLRGDVRARLAGVEARGGGLLVDPTNPEASVLYTKTKAPPPFGARMPLGGEPLDEATTACLLEYLREANDGGAPPEGGE